MSGRAPWGTVDGVAITEARTVSARVVCRDCAWRTEDTNSPAAVARGRRHATYKGHRLYIERQTHADILVDAAAPDYGRSTVGRNR